MRHGDGGVKVSECWLCVSRGFVDDLDSHIPFAMFVRVLVAKEP